ncbi:MAG TPA: MFS transporter, partial [Chloroflexota bacterium]
SMAFGSVHQGLLTPTLPLYVASLGYSEVTVGLVLAAFSVTSFTIRPWLGHLADSWSVRGVLGLSGALIGLPALVLAVPSVWAVAASNAVRGIGWAAFNTGGNTLLAHIAPPARRGEAASWLSLFQDVSLALGPPLALWLVSQGGSDGGGFVPVFLLATVAGLLVVGSAWMVPPAAGRVGHAALDKAPAAEPVSGLARFYDRGVLLASLLLVCLVLAAPSMSAFAPLYARSLGIGVESLSVYYLAVGATVVVGRFTLRHFSDRYGRGPALVAGFVCGGLGLLVMATASSLAALVAAGVIFSIGQSLHQPSTLALAIDRANPLRRGAAMASFTLWFQIGAGVGSAAAGALAAGMGYTTMYLIAIATPLAGLVLVAFNWRNLERPLSTTR